MEIKSFFDFCSGIGGGRLGLEQCGLECVGYSDSARISPITYRLLHNTENEKNFGNLKKIKCEELPKFDLLIAGFPCQTFSVMGKKNGFDDKRGQIIFHIARILKETQPKCFLLENVRGLVSHDGGNTIKVILKELEYSGYTIEYKILNSLNYGVPQMRQRVYFVGVRKDISSNLKTFSWPTEVDKPHLDKYLVNDHEMDEQGLYKLKKYLENPTNKGKYTIEDLLEMNGKILDTRMNDLRIYEDKCPTLRVQRDGVLYVRDGKIYQLSGYEALLLQGFPNEYADKVKKDVSDRHLLMQAGNAMTVNVIQMIGDSIIDYLKNK